MIVGGVQDVEKQNNLNLLFYKTQQNRIFSDGLNCVYEIKLDYRPHIASEKDFEITLNAA